MDLLKDMIDKQNTSILETNRVRYFIRTNQPIIGTYLLGDKSSNLKNIKKPTSKAREMNSDSQFIYHQFQTPVFTNPTILMYTIIKNKPIFLESLLQIYLEMYPKKYKRIINQGFLKKKINILNLSIESKSNECFDIILNFFHKYKLAYNLREKIEFSAQYNNLYTLEKFLNEDQELYEDIKKYAKIEQINSEQFNDSIKNEKYIMKRILIEVKKGILNNINEKKDSTTAMEENSIKSLSIISVNQNLSTDSNESDLLKCSYDGCQESANLEKCLLCGKMFCDEHKYNHGC